MFVKTIDGLIAAPPETVREWRNFSVFQVCLSPRCGAVLAIANILSYLSLYGSWKDGSSPPASPQDNARQWGRFETTEKVPLSAVDKTVGDS